MSKRFSLVLTGLLTTVPFLSSCTSVTDFIKSSFAAKPSVTFSNPDAEGFVYGPEQTYQAEQAANPGSGNPTEQPITQPLPPQPEDALTSKTVQSQAFDNKIAKEVAAQAQEQSAPTVPAKPESQETGVVNFLDNPHEQPLEPETPKANNSGAQKAKEAAQAAAQAAKQTKQDAAKKPSRPLFDRPEQVGSTQEKFNKLLQAQPEYLNHFERAEYNELFALAQKGLKPAVDKILADGEGKTDYYVKFLAGIAKVRGLGGYEPDLENGSILINIAAYTEVQAAQEYLATYYLAQNKPEQVIEWCERAINNSVSPKCEYILGWMYENEQGVVQDTKKAYDYYLKAAAHDFPEALFKVGEFNFWGQYLPKDHQVARKYLREAAQKGSANAKALLGFYQVMYPASTKEAEQGEKYLAEAIKANNSNAIFYRAYEVLKGNDAVSGLKLLEQASKNNHVMANRTLGDLYFTGGSQDFPVLKVDINYPLALKYYERAAQYGSGKMQLQAGFMHYKGLGVPVNYERAAYWLQRAANTGESFALGTLALMYQLGHGVEKDLVHAQELYKKACEAGYRYACTVDLNLDKKSEDGTSQVDESSDSNAEQVVFNERD